MTVLALVHCCKYAPYVPEFSFLSSHLALVLWCCGLACSSSFSAAGGSTCSLQRTNMCTDGSTFSLQRTNMCADANWCVSSSLSGCNDYTTLAEHHFPDNSYERNHLKYSCQLLHGEWMFSLKYFCFTAAVMIAGLCREWKLVQVCGSFAQYLCKCVSVTCSVRVQVCVLSLVQYLCKCVCIICSVLVQMCVCHLFNTCASVWMPLVQYLFMCVWPVQYMCKRVCVTCSVLVQMCVCHMFNMCASVWLSHVQYVCKHVSVTCSVLVQVCVCHMFNTYMQVCVCHMFNTCASMYMSLIHSLIAIH